MKKIVFFLCLAMITGFSSADEPAKNRLHFKNNNFSIAPLDEKSTVQSYQLLVMFLPASDAFAPNVNVILQQYSDTMESYAALSRQEFQDEQWTILKEETVGNSIHWETSGMFQGQKLHWYMRADFNNGTVYLITATATENQWKTVGTKLTECVDSFQLDDIMHDADNE
ncbi:MAG: hypothetical protein H7A34_07745 [bacterium]|nr:hypothetical protein [bacterium]